MVSTDEDQFANRLLWKNLQLHILWDSEKQGQRVQIWGDRSHGVTLGHVTCGGPV